EALAAAYALLRMADPERAAPVLDALGGGEGETLWALARGIGYAPAPAPAVSDALRRLVGSREAPGPAAAAAEALAFHGALELPPDRLAAFLGAEDAAVRCAGWRLVGYLLMPVDAKQ